MEERYLSVTPESNSLILYFPADVKTLFKEGKNYQWQRPKECPKCKGKRLWSHGFTSRYFEGFIKALWVKKYRCPDCKSVHTCRPEGFFKKFIYSINTISSCLKSKIEDYLWSKKIAYQNQQYWYKGLRFQSSRKFNVKVSTVAFFKRLLSLNIIPVSHSIQCEILRL